MKYNIIVTDEEIEKIFAIKKECHNLRDFIIKVKEEFEDFDLNSLKYHFIINCIIGVEGNLERNPKDMICPNCLGKYVVRTYAGDLYYRLLNGNTKQKKEENQKFLNMGLYSNPWATESQFTRDYQCLKCGIRWNGKDKNIIKD